MSRNAPPSHGEVDRSTAPLSQGRRRSGATAFVSAMLLAATFGVASAQDARGILAAGNAVVTGFSGTQAPPPAPNADPADLTEIDLSGPSVRIVDLQAMGGAPQAQLVQAAKPFTATAGQLGQVFAVALDDAAAPNIYVAATSAYGLPIVAPGPGGGLVRARQGAPNASFMPGLFGPATVGGGPGSIWRIDGVTGAVTLFANVTLDGAANPGAALGGLAFDKTSHMLFVADRGTGMIHAFDLNGQERGRYDHGTQGRAAAGLPPVPYDPARRLDITSASFKTDDPSTWGFAADERRVFGLGVQAGRLYYAVAGEQVWSVSIMPDGSFGSDARIDVQVPPWDGESEISKITFDDTGAMLLAERAVPTGAYDFAALAREAVGRVLRYQQVAPQAVAQPGQPAPDQQPAAMPANQPGAPAPDGASLWQPVPDEYAIGFPAELRNDNGGIAIGYSYTPAGTIDRSTCGGFLWSTGERLRETADQALAARLAGGGPAIVNGLQGNALDLVRPANVPPLSTYFVDYDDKFDEAAARGHMGDIAIPRACGQGGAVPAVPVVEAGGIMFGGFCQLNQIRMPNGECCERRFVRQGRCEQRCPPDTIRLPNGQCCPRQYVHNGQCCPPELLRDGRCDCPPDTIRLPNGQCCPRQYVHNGQCCPPELLREGKCQQCPPDTVRLPNGECCPRQYVHNGQCCPPTLVAPGCQPPPSTCPPGTIQLPNGQCCPRQNVHNGKCEPPPPSTCPPGQTQLPNGQCCPVLAVLNGQCTPPPPQCAPGLVLINGQCQQPVPPRINLVPSCRRGTVRLPDGSCGHPPTVVRPHGRLHVDEPPRHKPTPRRERSVAPNWKPLHTGGQNLRLNTFHPQVQGGGGMGGTGGHRFR
jgi:hypothetical protein